MNALGIAQAVHELGGTLLVEHGQVVVRSHGPLPDELQREVRAHKAELLIALGVPMDQTVASILGDLRPLSAAVPPAVVRRLPARARQLEHHGGLGPGAQRGTPVTSPSPLRRAVRVCPAASGRPAADTDRLIALLATGLERWLTRQTGEENVDFLPGQSVTTTHEDNDVLEGYR